MSGRLAVDFGTSNTVVAVWEEAEQEARLLHIPGYGRVGDDQVSVVPSLIHYAADGRRWVGNQVLERNLYHSGRTFRWMKRYIGHRSPTRFRLDGQEVSFFDAGSEFLAAVMTFAGAELGMGDEEIALTVPVEWFEHYPDWLQQVAEKVGLPRFRLIDEPSAAALGYGANIQPGDVYLAFDFGGGTLDVAVVLIEEEESARGGQRCRVVGKAGAEIGGITLDQWLFEEVLRRNKRTGAEEEVRQLGRALLVECERAKERLSLFERADVGVTDPNTGAVLGAEFTRGEFEELLDRREAFALIDRTLRRALNAALERGYQEDDVRAVLAVGGSSLIPSVQRRLGDFFGRERVFLDRPLDAVARGAAAFVAGVDFYDHIQHDYAVRFVDTMRGAYDYRVIVKRGTPYPTKGTVTHVEVKATHEEQSQLGLAIFEIGERRRGPGQARELVYDPSGVPRLVEVTPEEDERRTYFWMNERTPTFLFADPPAAPGKPRFRVEFSVDGNKRLLITTRDLETGRVTHRDYPVVKLT